MLPREHRLTTGTDFRRVSRHGRRAGSKRLVVHLWVPGTSEVDIRRLADCPARAGFVVGKRVGNAVVRNRVKRRLRHMVREHLEQIPATGMLVVRALPAAAAASYTTLAGDLERCLGRVVP